MRTNRFFSPAAVGCLCAVGCEVFFGLSTVFTKHATGMGSELTLLGWRFFIAFVAMSLLVLFRAVRVDYRGKKKSILFLIALFSPVLYFLFETVGISRTTASESGAFFAGIPVVSLIASTLILKKKPNANQIVGIGITVVGVLVTVAAAGMEASFSAAGYLFLTLAVVSYSLYCVCVEKATAFTGIEITYIMLLSACTVFVSLALFEGAWNQNLHTLLILPFRNPGFLLAVLYQGIGCSILAFFMSNVAIAKIGVNRTSTFIGVSTVVSVGAGILLLNEEFSVFQTIGVTVILIGVYTANLQGRRANKSLGEGSSIRSCD